LNPLQFLKPVLPSATTLTKGVSVDAQQSTTESTSKTGPDKQERSVHVDISALGRKKLEQENKDKDIEDSELPSHVKQTLKTIRRNQERLKQKQEELAKAQQDPGLQGKQKEEKLKSLQAEISDLQRMISTMKSELLKAAEKEEFSADQMKSIASLMG